MLIHTDLHTAMYERQWFERNKLSPDLQAYICEFLHLCHILAFRQGSTTTFQSIVRHKRIGYRPAELVIKLLHNRPYGSCSKLALSLNFSYSLLYVSCRITLFRWIVRSSLKDKNVEGLLPSHRARIIKPRHRW